MNLLLAFLLATFVIGGATARPPAPIRRPVLLVGASAVVAVGFYSLRVL